MSAGNNIKVVCRFRPLNSIERRENSKVVVDFEDNLQTVRFTDSTQGLTGAEKDGFTYDRIFGMDTPQLSIFEYGIKETVEDVMNGYNGTIFSYGQTGSGKTFTMMGADIDSPQLKGITPRITEQIFDSIRRSGEDMEYLVKVSYMEIYMEKIRDLLAPANDNLQVHEEKSRGVYVKGLREDYVSDEREVYEIMREGGSARAVSSTNMNAESSRSHSIFVIAIQQKNLETGTQKNGHLFLVDLAGSEKIGKTGATGQTLEEAKKINKSLSALGMVINALTDGKSSHVPYRDSKLTRILQESLGGNSRTTLIINCSPASYNEAETLSTLRFGMRAKSIKNKARVNAELSPAELKALLRKSQSEAASMREYVAALEAELGIWRSGGQVAQSDWSTASLSVKRNETPIPSTPRSSTPSTSLLSGFESSSRPMTPGAILLDKDEREDFLKRENELADSLAEKERILTSSEKALREAREELEVLREQERTMNKDNKAMSSQLNELRMALERLEYENKEGVIQIDTLKEVSEEHEKEVEDLRKQLEALKASAKDAVTEEKEKKKAEKMAMMLAKFDAQGAFSEKEDQIRTTLSKLDAMDFDDPSTSLTPEDLTLLRRQLGESQALVRDTHDRLRQAQEEADIISRRKEEVEIRLNTLEGEYEELLEKTIHEEERSNVDLADTMADIKAKLEAQYAAKRDVQLSEIYDLKQQLESKSSEIRNLNITVESLKGVNEELKRAFEVTSAGIEGGKNLAESAKDLERTRKAIAVQLSDFESSKRNLMRDLQNRCEKVVELEIQLDDLREQYNTVIRSSNSKAQQKKMLFLERNLEALGVVQKQLVDQNSALKKESGIAERKLLARNERIVNLEQLLQDADRRLMAQNMKFESQLQAVRDRLEQAKSQKAASGPAFSGRIAKPIRGGGAAAPAPVPSPSSGTIPGSSLSRIQNDEASASQKRASWFFSNNRGAV